MKINLTAPDFKAAIPLLQQIEEAGYEAYFVGGSVRDALLNLPIHDVDIATSAYPAEIKAIFPKTVDTGIQHGTVMVLAHGTGYEITTFRTESGYQDFRRPDHVTFVRSLKEDLKRRDFTVNALAVRHDGTVVDLFGGLNDLKAKLLRAVGNPHARFHEDALRMMRAVRFESQLDFTIEPATQGAIKENAALLEKISVERIASEFTRLMLGGARQNGLQTFLATDLFRHVPLFGDRGAGLRALSELPQRQITDPAVAWTLVCVELDLPVAAVMKAWKQANALASTVSRAVALVHDFPLASQWQLYSAGEVAVQVAAIAEQYLEPRFSPEKLLARYHALPIHAKHELAVTGAALIKAGMQPGPKLGQVLRWLEQQVVSGALPNDAAVLVKVGLDHE